MTTGRAATDPGDPIIAALADQIADRLAHRLRPQLAEIIDAGGLHTVPPVEEVRKRAEMGARRAGDSETENGETLWTARRVAAHYYVAVSFIYQHADELGCVRLGGGKRPRLRFDPRIVHERWPHVGGVLPTEAAQRSRSGSRGRVRGRTEERGYELLEFEREP